MLVRHGYGVLLLDARGYDGSQGDPNLFGWDDAKDIDAAVAWLQQRPDVRDGRIGGIGFSVGGEMMLASRRREHRAARGRLRGRRLPLGPRGAAARPARLVHLAARAGGAERGARRDERHRAAAVAERPRAADRAAARLPHLRRPRRRRRGIQPRLLRRRRQRRRRSGRSRKHTTPAATRHDPTNTNGASSASSTARCSERSEHHAAPAARGYDGPGSCSSRRSSRLTSAACLTIT